MREQKWLDTVRVPELAQGQGGQEEKCYTITLGVSGADVLPMGHKMINAEDATVWVNWETKQVEVARGDHSWPRYHGWCELIGAARNSWKEGTSEQRTRELLEAALWLASLDFDMRAVLTAFAKIAEFDDLARTSGRMRGVLTWALLGKSYTAPAIASGKLAKEEP